MNITTHKATARAKEEENIYYVALTRTQEKLTLVHESHSKN
jgi:ATP-dependent exoDNAse (exonuclease V) beta subunit